MGNFFWKKLTGFQFIAILWSVTSLQRHQRSAVWWFYCGLWKSSLLSSICCHVLAVVLLSQMSFCRRKMQKFVPKNIFIVLGLSQRTDCIIYNYFNKEILWLEFSSRCQFVGREIYTWYGLQSFQYHMVPPYWWMGKRDVIDWKRPPWRFLRRSVSGHRRPCQPGGGIRLRVEAYLMFDIQNGRGASSFL